jgi:acetylornithine deacetylase
MVSFMNVFDLTRKLIDIESITPNEEAVGEFLFAYLSEIAARTNGLVERMDVEPHRFNVFAHWGDPDGYLLDAHGHRAAVLRFARRRQIHLGPWRVRCKRIIASMIFAVEALLAEGVRGLGLLFVVGEERNSAGAFAAAKQPRGSRFLINGEPTENKLALGSKGALRYEITGARPHGALRVSAPR